MDIKSGDPSDNLKIILEDYKITPNTFGLISGLDEKTVLEFSNHKADLAHLPHEKIGHIVSMIGLLSDGMTLVTADERVKAIIEILNDNFQISANTLALYAKIEEKDVDEFMRDFDSLAFEKRYPISSCSFISFQIVF
ncbi:HTH domain-containing protein [Bacillus sp. JJ1503]|uniref:HTH domain-containing protein n=1 Tax=Bacillus sp. JJ1503 TaxID=3122956 RepID=UPI002FFD9BDA